MKGYTSFPRQEAADMVRGKAELFSDHYSQARLFWESQSPIEQAHIIAAFRFELTRVQTVAVRARVVSMLANVNSVLATRVAEGLGIEVPDPMPLALDSPIPEFPPSPALSLLSRPGRTGIRTRRIAILVAPGVKGEAVHAVYDFLLSGGAVPRLAGSRLGRVTSDTGQALDVEISLEAGPSVLYDALVLPDGAATLEAWEMDAHTVEFVRDQYRHCKPMLVIGEHAEALLEKAGVLPNLPDGSPDLGIINAETSSMAAALKSFKNAIAAHRVFDRETDPPRV
jgi:catalase